MNVKQIKEALERNFGLLALTAKELSIDINKLKEIIDNNKELQEHYYFIKEFAKDRVELALLANAIERDKECIKLYLQAKAKERGYAIKEEQRDELPHRIIIEIVSSNKKEEDKDDDE